MENGKCRLYGSLLAVILLASVAARITFPSADPPVGLSNSRGIIVDGPKNIHNARNRILYGQWRTDEGWNPLFYSPTFTLGTYASFRLFGFGLSQARLYPILSSILSVLLLFLIAKRGWGWRAGLLACALLGFDFTAVSYGRLALFETPMLTYMLLSIFLWQRGSGGSPVFLILSGVSLGLAFLGKSLAVYFIGCFFLTITIPPALEALETRRLPSLAKGLWVLSGFFAAMVCSYLIFFRPNQEWISNIGSGWLGYAFPTGPLGTIRNMLRFSAVYQFRHLLPTFLLALWWVFSRMARSVEDRRMAFDSLELLCTLWFLLGSLFLSSLAYRPTRYFIPLIAPMCLLAVRTLQSFWVEKQEEEFSLPGKGIQYLFFVGISWMAFIWWIYTPYENSQGTGLLDNRSTVIGFFLGILFSLFLGAAQWLAFSYWRKTGQPVGDDLNRRSKTIRTVLLSIVFLPQLFLYGNWALSREYGVREGSLALQSMNDAVIAGRVPNNITMENELKPVVLPGWWDDGLLDAKGRDLFQRYPITHIVTTTDPTAVTWFYTNYIEHLSRSKHAAIARFGGFDYPVYEITQVPLKGPPRGGVLRLEAEEQFYQVGHAHRDSKTQGTGTLISSREKGFLLLTTPFLPDANAYRFIVKIRGNADDVLFEVRRSLVDEPLATRKFTLKEKEWWDEDISTPTPPGEFIFLSVFVEGKGITEIDHVSIQGM